MDTSEQKAYTEQPVNDSSHLEWFQEFNAFWVAGVVPLILAWFTFKVTMAKIHDKQEEMNEKKRQRARALFDAEGTMSEADLSETKVMEAIGEILTIVTGKPS